MHRIGRPYLIEVEGIHQDGSCTEVTDLCALFKRSRGAPSPGAALPRIQETLLYRVLQVLVVALQCAVDISSKTNSIFTNCEGVALRTL